MRRFLLSASVGIGLLVPAFAAEIPRWISGGGASPESPAPVLERTFSLQALPSSAAFEIAVAGWCEVSLNGEKIGDRVLEPVTCQPSRRISTQTFDLAGKLRPGDNVLAVTLGNGWWNCFTRCTWKFHEAPWISAPKICGELRLDGRRALVTDETWRAYDSPTVFNALRNGEWYDARLEGARRRERPATVEKHAPLVEISPEDAAPCRVFETFEPKRTVLAPDGSAIYDFDANIAGWCEIEVKGEPGARIVLDYDEWLSPSNTFVGRIGTHVRRCDDPRPPHHDEYTLAGRSTGERWHPRFVCHGFRYANVHVEGKASVLSIRARFVHSDFPSVGTLETSDPTFARLQSATIRSYLSNFVGYPTDCPHREKNGWTGDAQLAMETGLWNFDAQAGYRHYLRMLLDAQAPNGALPCIVPVAPGFGYGWGSGPAWDAVLFEIPWQLYRFYGDDSAARESYPAMKRYLSFIRTKADSDGLYAYGLGDWCQPKELKRSDLRVTDSAYVYQFHRRAAFWARRFGEVDYARECDAVARSIAEAFNRVLYRGDGLYASGSSTELAAPLFFEGLCADGEKTKVLKRLVDSLRKNGHRANFGILGAKWIPRVLAENGYVDDAWRIFVQPDYPGWVNWLSFGGGTLHEYWDSENHGSRNHIMYGDLSAWAYEHVAGIVPLEPGFAKVAIRPQFPKGVESFSATHRTPRGEIRVAWHLADGKPVVEVVLPDGIERQ